MLYKNIAVKFENWTNKNGNACSLKGVVEIKASHTFREEIFENHVPDKDLVFSSPRISNLIIR